MDKTKNLLVSVAIPTYEMSGRGVDCLRFCLDTIYKQSYDNFQIVVSDHSQNDEIEEFCSTLKNIKYVRNEFGRGSLAANLNSCIRNSDGDIIKFVMQDDFLYGTDALKEIVGYFNDDAKWLVSSYYHTHDRKNLINMHIPSISNDMLFNNRIGTPTCLTIRNGNNIYFDENLNWYVDSDFYLRTYAKYGEPVFLKIPTAVQYLWEGQSTNIIINEEVIRKENSYLMKKYGRK